MNFKNPKNGYSIFSRFLHWSMAIIIIGLLVLGIYMEDLKPSPDKFQLYSWHKSFGILVLALGLLRLTWHFISPPPPLIGTPSKKEKYLAKTVHLLLIAFMISLPVSGLILSSSGGYPVEFFGLFAMPDLMDKNHDIHEIFEEIHEIGGLILIGLIILHVAAALKHHFIKKDDTLKRMTSG